MKTNFFLTAIAALALNTQTATADNVANFNVGMTEVRINTTEQKMFNLELQRTKTNETIHILIQNDDNQVIFEENLLGETAYSKHYNLAQLSTGDYTVTVEKATVKAVHNLRILRKGISVGEQPSQTFYKPVVMQEKDLLKLQLLLETPGTVKVTICDANMATVFVEKYRDVTTFGKTYNIEALPNGTYFLIINMSGTVTEQTITVAH